MEANVAKTMVMTVTLEDNGLVKYNLVSPTGNTLSGGYMVGTPELAFECLTKRLNLFLADAMGIEPRPVTMDEARNTFGDKPFVAASARDLEVEGLFVEKAGFLVADVLDENGEEARVRWAGDDWELAE